MTVKGSGAITGTTFSGTADLTGIGTNLPLSGTFSTTSTGSYSAVFVITVNSADKLNVTVTIPPNILTGSADASAQITGGTGAYAGATGSFPKMPGTGSLDPTTFSLVLSFSGPGTIITGGTGGGGGANGPTVTEVLDAASYTKNIAQGSIFVVKGTNLSASGFTQFSFPLPASSSGVKITFTPTAGGSGTDAYLVYLYNQGGVNQLAAVLPSSVAPGNYNVTVTNGTTSAPVAVTVVQRKIGLITADSSGSGLAVIQNYISASQLDIDRFTTFSSGGYTFSPSKPGQVLIAWATGMGPVTGGDNVASPGFDFAANGVNVTVIVGGVSITPLYAGRAPGLAGADQINFQLPADVPTGCTVSFQVSVNGVLSNPSFIAIAPDGSSNACVYPGFTTDQLKNFDNGGTYTVGSFGLSSLSITIPGADTFKTKSASGGFYKFTGFQLSGAAQYTALTNTSGACQVIHIQQTSGSTSSSGTVTGLDAGTVTLNGPAGSNISNVAMKQDATSKSYSLSLGTEGLGVPIPGQINANIVAGTYSVKGNGGADVGAFNSSITVGAPLTITGGLPSVVNRSAGLPLAWTGGDSTDLVQILGYAGTVTGSGSNAVTDAWEFICTTTAGQGGFTVPASVLNQLPAVSAASLTNFTGSTILEVVSSATPSSFTAPLTAGDNVNAAYFFALTGIANTPTYQ